MARPCNRENMLKFIDALVYGGYEQCSGKLCESGKYCCLGVACEVAIKNGVELNVVNVDPTPCLCGAVHGDEDGTGKTYDGETGILPPAVAAWLGLEDERDERGEIVSSDRNPRLAGVTATAWNDSLKASFRIIGQLFRHEFVPPTYVPTGIGTGF